MAGEKQILCTFLMGSLFGKYTRVSYDRPGDCGWKGWIKLRKILNKNFSYSLHKRERNRRWSEEVKYYQLHCEYLAGKKGFWNKWGECTLHFEWIPTIGRKSFAFLLFFCCFCIVTPNESSSTSSVGWSDNDQSGASKMKFLIFPHNTGRNTGNDC